LQISEDSGKYWLYQYCRYWYTSIADTGIPVLQILEESRKYWLYQHCRYWKILKNTGNTSIADTGRFWKILGY
jgi:hypothetical protein